MAIPESGYVEFTIVNPIGSLSDFPLLLKVDSTQTDFWSSVDSADPTRARAALEDGTEIPVDVIHFDTVNEVALYRCRASLASSGTQKFRVYPPLSTNPAYAADDTYGSQAVYNSEIDAYYPFLSNANDRTENAFHLTVEGTAPSYARIQQDVPFMQLQGYLQREYDPAKPSLGGSCFLLDISSSVSGFMQIIAHLWEAYDSTVFGDGATFFYAFRRSGVDLWDQLPTNVPIHIGNVSDLATISLYFDGNLFGTSSSTAAGSYSWHRLGEDSGSNAGKYLRHYFKFNVAQSAQFLAYESLQSHDDNIDSSTWVDTDAPYVGSGGMELAGAATSGIVRTRHYTAVGGVEFAGTAQSGKSRHFKYVSEYDDFSDPAQLDRYTAVSGASASISGGQMSLPGTTDPFIHGFMSRGAMSEGIISAEISASNVSGIRLLANENSGYLVVPRSSPHQTVVIYKIRPDAGIESIPPFVNIPFVRDTPHLLEVEFGGGNIEVRWDGITVLSVFDTTHTSGQFGLGMVSPPSVWDGFGFSAVRGGASLSGEATVNFSTEYTYIPTGGIELSGTAIVSRTSEESYIASGGIEFSGAAILSKAKVSVPVGGIEFSGAAITVVSKQFQFTASGGMAISGDASTAAQNNYYYSAAGGLSISGSAESHAPGNVYTGFGGLEFAGSAIVAVSKQYDYAATGGIEILGSADTFKSREFLYVATGGLVISGEAIYNSGFLPSGGMVISGEAITAKYREYDYFAAGGLSVSSSAIYSIDYGPKHWEYIPTGGLRVYGVARVVKTTGSGILPNTDWYVAPEDEIGAFLYGRLLEQKNPLASRDSSVIVVDDELVITSHIISYVGSSVRIDGVHQFSEAGITKLDITYDVFGYPVIAYIVAGVGYVRYFDQDDQLYVTQSVGSNIADLYCCSVERRAPGQEDTNNILLVYSRDGQVLTRSSAVDNYNTEASTSTQVPEHLDFRIIGFGLTEDHRMQIRLRVRRKYVH